MSTAVKSSPEDCRRGNFGEFEELSNPKIASDLRITFQVLTWKTDHDLRDNYFEFFFFPGSVSFLSFSGS